MRNKLVGKRVLVTGASGFLGSRTVAALVEHGCIVHALVRKTSRTDHLTLPHVTIVPGDIADTESLKPAFAGVEYVLHAAADTRGDKEAGESSTVQGTRNVLALSAQFKVRKLVYISSCSVYGTADYNEGEVVTEESMLERFPEQRGAYSHAKFRAEQLVINAMAEEKIPIVCLRPGTIYGPGSDLYSPMLGLSLGNKIFAVIGNGDFILPLVYVDNMVEAILAATISPFASRIYNVIDPEKVTKKQYMEDLVHKLYPDSRTVYVPFSLLQALVFFQEKVCRALGRPPVLTLYRLHSSQKAVVYEALKIARDLAWRPPVTAAAAFDTLIRYSAGRN